MVTTYAVRPFEDVATAKSPGAGVPPMGSGMAGSATPVASSTGVRASGQAT